LKKGREGRSKRGVGGRVGEGSRRLPREKDVESGP